LAGYSHEICQIEMTQPDHVDSVHGGDFVHGRDAGRGLDKGDRERAFIRRRYLLRYRTSA
jgi:hypothetical protein